MRHEWLRPCSQQPVTGSFPEPDEVDQYTRRHIPEDINFPPHLCESIKYIIKHTRIRPIHVKKYVNNQNTQNEITSFSTKVLKYLPTVC
jgi:hypothetical protein